MVLVRNDGLLPLGASGLSRVAVLGESARRARTQGGGSSEVMPGPVVSPLAGLREALSEHVVVDHLEGAAVQLDFAVFDRDTIRNPITGGPGARVRYLDAAGTELLAEDRYAGGLRDFGGDTGVSGCAVVTFSTDYLPDRTGSARIGFAHPGTGRLRVDGELVLEGTIEAMGQDQIDAFFAPESLTVAVPVTTGVPRRLDYEFEPGEVVDGVEDSFTVFFGVQPTPQDDDALIEEAVRAAAAADVAVVVVGTTPQIESEGFDRVDLRLPGRQDDLVAAVAAANPRTVVVVNAGGPVEMPWRNDVAAVLLAWFPGQEFGHALADVLLGDLEPGGRLPTTWPVALADAPVSDVTPVDGLLSYDEGIHIGYRAWLRAGVAPAYPFGFGLGYTTWEIGPARVEESSDGVTLVARVTNTGARAGKQVLQAYAARPDSEVERPVRWLVGFDVVRLGPGDSADVSIPVPRRALAHWDGAWNVEAGAYDLAVGTSSVIMGDPVTVDLSGGRLE
jgi:beta-glucosidase